MDLKQAMRTMTDPEVIVHFLCSLPPTRPRMGIGRDIHNDYSFVTRASTPIEDAVDQLVAAIIATVPESGRYGITQDELEVYLATKLLNMFGDNLRKDVLDDIRNVYKIDSDLDRVICRAHWLMLIEPRTLDEIVIDFFREFDSMNWYAYSHVEDKGKKGKHYLHIETIGVSLVLYLKKNEYDVEGETPSYYIRHIEVKNTSELPKWAQPKKSDES